MKYLLLAYGNEKKMDALSKQELAAIGAECRPYDEELRKSGRVVAMGSLAPTRLTTTIRTRNGRLLTTDGPFAETREGVGGFFLVDVQDLAAAIKVAERAPRRPLRRRRDPPGAGVAAAVYIDRPGYAGPGRSKRPKCFSTRVRGAQPSMADRSSRLRRSGSARISISTTLPPAIVKPSTANRRPSGRRDTNPRWPLTRTS